MRLVSQENHLVPQFTSAWGVEYLAELSQHWVPFALLGQTTPIGEIHAEPHAIRLFEGVTLKDSQAVVLCRLSLPASANGRMCQISRIGLGWISLHNNR